MPHKLNLIGTVFHWLTVIGQAETVNARTRWDCECKCGKIVTVTTDALRHNSTRSCGCWKAQESAKRLKSWQDNTRANGIAWPKSHFTHGQSASPLYRAWQLMRDRCTNPRNHKYQIYGGRGIRVCDRWNSFELFSNDMGQRPSAAHSLDRIDNNGNYEPGNVRWATQREQQNNRRDNVLITIFGETKTCAEWSRLYKIRPNLVLQRIVRDKWEPAKALGIAS